MSVLVLGLLYSNQVLLLPAYLNQEFVIDYLIGSLSSVIQIRDNHVKASASQLENLPENLFSFYPTYAFNQILVHRLMNMPGSAMTYVQDSDRYLLIWQITMTFFSGVKASELTVDNIKDFDEDVGCPICRRNLTFNYKVT